MIEITEYQGETEELYDMWLETSRHIPYTVKMDLAAFKSAFLVDALAQNFGYMAREGGIMKGAALIHLYPGWGAVLQLWVPHERLGDEVSVKLLENAIGLCREKKAPQISPKPLLGSQRYNEFFFKHGFIRNEEYPEGLWMRKLLKKISDFAMPDGVKITFTKDLDESGFIEGLARLEVDIAREQNNLDLKLDENILSLRKEMIENDVVYGVASVDSQVVGYSRTVFAVLFSGGGIAKNSGLGVREDFRNKRIGEALLTSSMNMVKDRGHGEMFISTHSKNPARRLYERVGFETVETVPSQVLKFE